MAQQRQRGAESQRGEAAEAGVRVDRSEAKRLRRWWVDWRLESREVGTADDGQL